MHSRVRRTARGGDERERFASRADENVLSDALALARPDPERPELDPEEADDENVADPAEVRDPSRDLASGPLAKSSTRSVEGVEGVFEGRRGAARTSAAYASTVPSRPFTRNSSGARENATGEESEESEARRPASSRQLVSSRRPASSRRLVSARASVSAQSALVSPHTSAPAFFSCVASRAAVLTTSPYRAYSHRAGVPTKAQNASPVHTPARSVSEQGEGEGDTLAWALALAWAWASALASALASSPALASALASSPAGASAFGGVSSSSARSSPGAAAMVAAASVAANASAAIFAGSETRGARPRLDSVLLSDRDRRGGGFRFGFARAPPPPPRGFVVRSRARSGFRSGSRAVRVRRAPTNPPPHPPPNSSPKHLSPNRPPRCLLLLRGGRRRR